jgi:hypothetical protein
MPAFCRDCDSPVAEGQTTCPACGGARIARHPRMWIATRFSPPWKSATARNCGTCR